jgi:hypothetical protein
MKRDKKGRILSSDDQQEPHLVSGRQRDELGRLLPQEASLCRKVLSYRLPKPMYQAFMAAAKDEGISPGLLSRQIVEEWLKQKLENK